jgi:hypothetical protein
MATSPAYGSYPFKSLLILNVIVPPYCGMPCLSHQLPEVTVFVLVGLVVVGVADVVTAAVEDVTGFDAVVVDVVVDVVPQEASSIATTTAMLSVNHKIFFFNRSSILNCYREFTSE